MSDMLEKLKENRDQILLAEIGAYLHLIGRFSKEFVYSQAKETTMEFDYQKVCEESAFFEGTGLDELLKDRNLWEDLINSFKNLTSPGELHSHRTKNFCEFIEKHTWWKDGPKGLCRILADAHGIVSAIDKALAGRAKSGKQRKEYTFRATAFGYEKEIELFGSVNLDKVDDEKVKKIKKEFFQELKKILENIGNSKKITYDDYKNFVKLIKKYYSKTIGETRRPINEISLYDYAYTIASLVKSNLAKMIIDGWHEPRGKSYWRILKVNLNVIELLSKGLKVGDIFGYRKEIEDLYEKIKEIIEFEYPLGNEIYRDSTGIYFSCPDIKSVDKFRLEITDKLKSLNNLDVSLHIEISDESRSMVILAEERKRSLETISYLHFGDIEHIEKEFKESQKGGGDICPVCRIRLKTESEERCKKCKERYQKRAENWIDKPKETIWLDEVSDHNDRVALIIGLFDLRKWLSGEFIGIFVSQTFDEWKVMNTNLCNKLNINDISDLEKGFEELFKNPKSLNGDWRKICSSFIGVKINDFIKDFWKHIAERDATGKALELKNNSDKAKHLIKLLFRKHPSIARIYRVWQTTQDFINFTIFEEILKNWQWGPETRRQRIKFKIEPNPGVNEGATCDIDIDGVRFSPVCIDQDKGIFISTINLQILKKFGKSAEEIAKNINKKRIKVKTEKDRIWKDKKNGKYFTIEDASLADEIFQNYLPCVKVYNFPDQFMVLVPAYDAFDIAKKILEEYEIQFSKVRDRLPFHLGIIAFHRKTPLYVVMDAGKRLIDAFKRKTEEVNAKIDSIAEINHPKFGNRVKVLKLKPDPGYSSVPLVWYISYSTGDPEQEDLWHPYIRFNGDASSRNLSFDYTGKGDYVVHVKELKTGDEIKIEPSYFTLAYFENASDRFNIGDNLRPIDDIKRIDDIWKDIQNIFKSKELGISQLHAFWQEVKKRYDDYRGDSVWEDFVRSSLVNILKISPQKEKELFERLFQATKDFTLDLCLHWNLQVRKIKLKGGVENE